jgi:hypothetical protein
MSTRVVSPGARTFPYGEFAIRENQIPLVSAEDMALLRPAAVAAMEQEDYSIPEMRVFYASKGPRETA